MEDCVSVCERVSGVYVWVWWMGSVGCDCTALPLLVQCPVLGTYAAMSFDGDGSPI